MEAPLLFIQILKLYKLNQIKILTFNSLNFNNIYNIQNQTSISLSGLLKFFEGRVIQNRFFYKYFIFYKCLFLLPEYYTHNLTNSNYLIDMMVSFKKKLLYIFNFKNAFVNQITNISNFFIIGVIQKHTSNITLYELGIPLYFVNELEHNIKPNNLILAYDTSALVFNNFLKKLTQTKNKSTNVLFSMNIFDTNLLDKFNLIIAVANMYQIKESFLNIFLEKKTLHKINTSNFYDIQMIFQAIVSYIHLKYKFKTMAFYNLMIFSNIFTNFKKLRNKHYFKFILNLLILSDILYKIETKLINVILF